MHLQAVARAPWEQRVGAYSHLPSLIRQLGGDPDAMLRAVGIARDALDDPEGRVPYADLGALLRDSADVTGCAHFGLLAGRMWRLADLGLVGEVVANCRTVGEALEALTVYQHLNSDGGLVFLLRRSGVVDLGYAIYQPGVSGTDQIYDAVLAAIMNFMRELCGGGWRPSEVFLPHAKPAGFAHYRNLFKAHPRFDAETCALRFRACWMQHSIGDFDAQRARTARAQAESDDRAQSGLLQQVYRALRRAMLHGKTSGDDVAQMLSMHRRALNRKLTREGTTFQNVLDDVRFEVASELLGSSHIALDDIAAALGYAGVSPFMRAFHRWTGTTAGKWRRGAQRGALCDAPLWSCHSAAAPMPETAIDRRMVERRSARVAVSDQNTHDDDAARHQQYLADSDRERIAEHGD
jgi:AraC-like DNA-binding protein